MNSGEFTGLDSVTGCPTRVRWNEGRIVEKRVVPSAPDRHHWIAPPLTDLQVNGYAGVDFQADGLTESDLWKAADALGQAGCARILLTLITDDWATLLARMTHLRELRDRSASLKQVFVGWHIEGPFLSDRPGFHGAHEARWMIDPTPERIRDLRAVAPADPFLITLAPERAGSMASIAEAVRLGMRVSLGHTDASAETIAEAVKNGATGFTHLGNGCPQQLDRHDNILWRVLNQPELNVGLIPDSFHVSPALFGILHRVLPPERVFYVTDAMSAAGAPPGRYPLKGMELEVGADQVVRKPGTQQFAGSALSPIDGIRRAAKMRGVSWQVAWKSFSVVPSQWMNLSHELEVGGAAEFCLIREDQAGQIESIELVR